MTTKAAQYQLRVRFHHTVECFQFHIMDQPEYFLKKKLQPLNDDFRQNKRRRNRSSSSSRRFFAMPITLSPFGRTNSSTRVNSDLRTGPIPDMSVFSCEPIARESCLRQKRTSFLWAAYSIKYWPLNLDHQAALYNFHLKIHLSFKIKMLPKLLLYDCDLSLFLTRIV